MDKEIQALDKGLKASEHPCVFALGGAKVDDSIKVAQNVLRRGADAVLALGLVSVVFLMASGVNVGETNRRFVDSQGYSDQVEIAQKILNEHPGKVILPRDIAVDKDGERLEVSVDNIPDYPISDIGLETIVEFSKILKSAKIAVLNGPAGITEKERFVLGTAEILKAATEAGYSIAGGGHTVAAIEKLGLESRFSHVSMGGGASITYLSGEPMPGIEALKSAAARYRKL